MFFDVDGYIKYNNEYLLIIPVYACSIQTCILWGDVYVRFFLLSLVRNPSLSMNFSDLLDHLFLDTMIPSWHLAMVCKAHKLSSLLPHIASYRLAKMSQKQCFKEGKCNALPPLKYLKIIFLPRQ